MQQHAEEPDVGLKAEAELRATGWFCFWRAAKDAKLLLAVSGHVTQAAAGRTDVSENICNKTSVTKIKRNI